MDVKILIRRKLIMKENNNENQKELEEITSVSCGTCDMN